MPICHPKNCSGYESYCNFISTKPYFAVFQGSPTCTVNVCSVFRPTNGQFYGCTPYIHVHVHVCLKHNGASTNYMIVLKLKHPARTLPALIERGMFVKTNSVVMSHVVRQIVTFIVHLHVRTCTSMYMYM